MAYATRTNAESVFGVENIEDWANLDREDPDLGATQTKITNRITQIGSWVDAEIDDHAIQSGYVIPLVDSAGNTPATIEHLSAVLLGVWLYEAAGTRDIDPNTKQIVHRLAFREQWARKVLEEIKTGKRKLDAQPNCRT